MTDTEILDWLADNQVIEGFVNVEADIHEIAYDLWTVLPVKTQKESYRAALRELIARAAKSEAAKEAA